MVGPRKRRFKNDLYDQFARLAKAMASGRRLELIDLLAQGPRTVESVAVETEQSVANTSQHLQVLRQAGLVETSRRGNHIYYRLADDHVLRLWAALRIAGEARLAEIGALVQTFLSDRGALQPVSQIELRRQMEGRKVIVLDVRPISEYNAGHIAGARSIPSEELNSRLRELPKSRRIVAYCRGPYCVFADEAVMRLRARGYKACILEGGYPEWKLRGFPVTIDPSLTVQN
jgi:rhodanese-related sulfurtransferase/DNA-binding transcriptional ArsR family regulator